VEWYRSNFPEDTPIRGESSTSYTRDSGAAETARLVHEVLGTPKIIYLVRDPIERIRSDYHQYRAVGIEQRPIEEAVAEPTNRYLEASRYGSRIAPYVEQLGRDSVLVESQERLLNQRREVLERVFRFLGVRSDVQSPEFERMWERSEGKGWAYGLGWKLRERGVRLPAVLRWPAQRLQRSRFAGGAAPTARPPEVSETLRRQLASELRPEVARLRELTGAEFDEWRLD
jgi:Sulfotransferase domain